MMRMALCRASWNDISWQVFCPTANAMSGNSADLDLPLQLHVGGGRQVQLLRQLRHLRLQGALRRPAALTPLRGNQPTSYHQPMASPYHAQSAPRLTQDQLRHLRLEAELQPPAALAPPQGNQSTAGALASPDQDLCSALLMCPCACCGVICWRSIHCRLWRGLTLEWREPEPWLPVSILTPLSKCCCAPILMLSSSHAMGEEWPELSLPLHQ